MACNSQHKPLLQGKTVGHGGNMGKQKTERVGRQSCTVSDEAIFKVSKEIVVKFIEVGRLTPANFDITFKRVYTSIRETVQSGEDS